MLKLPDRYDDTNRISFVVVLVKETNLNGSLPVGRKFRWTYKHLPEHIAVHKAFDALVRDYPDEARSDWKNRK